jgi:hypothetical protein
MTGCKPNCTFSTDARFEEMICIILKGNQEIVESFRVERSMPSVDPTLDSILFRFRGMLRLKKFFHPAS